MTPRPYRAALYARVSTTDQGQDPENQLVPLRQLAERSGWTVVAEYVDFDSGGKADRSGLRRMLEAAARREFDVLLFWALDRLSREGALRTLQILEQLSRYGVAWRSLQEPYLDSAGPLGEAIIALLAALAKQERIRLQERVRAGLDRARRHDKKLGRPARVVDRRRIAELRARGCSWSEIARALGITPSLARRAFAAWQRRVAENPCREENAK